METAVLGLGVGWIDVPRFEAALARFGDRLRERLFTPGEREARGAQGLAVRLAAKTAARKALGLSRLRWREVEVVREPGRAPGLAFHGAARARARELGVTRVAVSLSHVAGGCLGQVVLEGPA